MVVGQESVVVRKPIQRRAGNGPSFEIHNSVPQVFSPKNDSSNRPMVQQLPRWGHLETFTVIKRVPAHSMTLRKHSPIPGAAGKTIVMGICYPLPQETFPAAPLAFKATGCPESAIRTGLKPWFSVAGCEEGDPLDVVEGNRLAEVSTFRPAGRIFKCWQPVARGQPLRPKRTRWISCRPRETPLDGKLLLSERFRSVLDRTEGFLP